MSLWGSGGIGLRQLEGDVSLADFLKIHVLDMKIYNLHINIIYHLILSRIFFLFLGLFIITLKLIYL